MAHGHGQGHRPRHEHNDEQEHDVENQNAELPMQEKSLFRRHRFFYHESTTSVRYHQAGINPSEPSYVFY